MSEKDGGSAFPTEAAYVHPADRSRLSAAMGWSPERAAQFLSTQPGMSLRDWFAGQALVGLLHRSWDHVAKEEMVARWAAASYALADALLAERAKGREP